MPIKKNLLPITYYLLLLNRTLKIPTYFFAHPWGGYTFAEKELGWNRRTIRKGMMELNHQISIADSFRLRGRQRIEEKLPNLRSDIANIIEPYCQTDPNFQSTKLYRRISVAKVSSLLIEEKGYTSAQLPSNETIRSRLNEMGYRLKRVQKRKPKKKFLKLQPFLNN